MANVIILKVDGSYEVKELETPSLEMMYREIGCGYVDVIRLRADIDMWADDDTPAGGLKVNPIASHIAKYLGDGRERVWGTVFLAGVKHGKTTGLNDPQEFAVKGVIAHILKEMTGTTWN